MQKTYLEGKVAEDVCVKLGRRFIEAGIASEITNRSSGGAGVGWGWEGEEVGDLLEQRAEPRSDLVSSSWHISEAKWHLPRQENMTACRSRKDASRVTSLSGGPWRPQGPCPWAKSGRPARTGTAPRAAGSPGAWEPRLGPGEAGRAAGRRDPKHLLPRAPRRSPRAGAGAASRCGALGRTRRTWARRPQHPPRGEGRAGGGGGAGPGRAGRVRVAGRSRRPPLAPRSARRGALAMRSLWLALCALARLWPGALAGCAEAGRCCPGRDPACFARGWRLDRVYGTCFCDQACRLTGDCCFDYDRACPGGWRGRGGAPATRPQPRGTGSPSKDRSPQPLPSTRAHPSITASPEPLRPRAPSSFHPRVPQSPSPSPCIRVYPAPSVQGVQPLPLCTPLVPPAPVHPDTPPKAPLPPESAWKVRAPSVLEGAGPPPAWRDGLGRWGGGHPWARFPPRSFWDLRGGEGGEGRNVDDPTLGQGNKFLEEHSVRTAVAYILSTGRALRGLPERLSARSSVRILSRGSRLFPSCWRSFRASLFHPYTPPPPPPPPQHHSRCGLSPAGAMKCGGKGRGGEYGPGERGAPEGAAPPVTPPPATQALGFAPGTPCGGSSQPPWESGLQGRTLPCEPGRGGGAPFASSPRGETSSRCGKDQLRNIKSV